MKATGKRRNARCAPICTHNAERGRGETTFNKLVSRASDGHTKRKMYGLAVLRLGRLTSFTDSVLSSPLLSWNGSWTWTDRKGGRARRRASGGQAFGPTTVVTTHTEDGADIAVSLAPSVCPSLSPPQTAEVRVELGGDRERGSQSDRPSLGCQLLELWTGLSNSRLGGDLH